MTFGRHFHASPAQRLISIRLSPSYVRVQTDQIVVCNKQQTAGSPPTISGPLNMSSSVPISAISPTSASGSHRRLDSDVLTVDSWGGATLMTTETEFQRQRTDLQNRRASVEEQLRELQNDGDTLEELQKSMQQWKPTPEHDNDDSSVAPETMNDTPVVQTVRSNESNTNAAPVAAAPTEPLPPRHPSMMPPPMSASMPPSAAAHGIPPSAAPPSHYGAPPPFMTPPTTGAPGSMDALAIQIQAMQRMQDWMLWQKEQECVHLRSRVEEAVNQANQLKVENALLQEKLHQQEQRMQHELKLLKMAAMQSRREKKHLTLMGDPGTPTSGADPTINVPSSTTSAKPQRAQRNFSDTTMSEYAKTGSQSKAQANLPLWPPISSSGGDTATTPSVNTNASRSIASETTEYSEEGKDAFDTNSVTWPGTSSNSGVPSASHHKQYKQKDGPLTRSAHEVTPVTSNKPKATRSHPWNSAAGNPTSANNNGKPLAASSGMDDFDNVSVPTDLYVDDQAPPTVPLEENITAGTTMTSMYPQQQHHPGTQDHAPLDANKLPPKYPPGSMPTSSSGANRNVSFVDDSASAGQTVASSTYGEDRQKVTDQVILDPYGDKGHYTGIILKSTGMPHGSGRMMYQEDQRTYNGEWRHGRWHGFGRATFANHDTYEGEYRFDQRHGRGCYSWSDGRVYDGMFKEDKRHGKGKFTWPDGAVYEGDFRNGQREGHGVYQFSDGGRYEGSWKDGRYNGFGICNWEDGRTYKGEWLNGMAHGKGVETFADGSIRHDGQWIEDEPR